SVTVMSIKSKMMGTTLMSDRTVVYDGRREVLTYFIRPPRFDVRVPSAERGIIRGEAARRERCGGGAQHARGPIRPKGRRHSWQQTLAWAR
ncbi:MULTISPECIES: hypothetical protein, partial [Burkholderia]